MHMCEFLNKILRAGEGKVLRKLKALSVQVNALEADFRAMSDEELRDLTPEFRARLEKGRLSTTFSRRRCRRPRGGHPHLGAAPLRRAGHGRCGTAPQKHRRDEDR